MAKPKKGGRTTPKKVVSCKSRPGQPCKFTSRKRVNGEEWTNLCSWCFRKEPK